MLTPRSNIARFSPQRIALSRGKHTSKMTVDLEQKQRDIEKYEESIYYSARYAGEWLAFRWAVFRDSRAHFGSSPSRPTILPDDEYEYRCARAISSPV